MGVFDFLGDFFVGKLLDDFGWYVGGEVVCWNFGFCFDEGIGGDNG